MAEENNIALSILTDKRHYRLIEEIWRAYGLHKCALGRSRGGWQEESKQLPDTQYEYS